MKIPVTFNPKNKFCIARVHYAADPDKSTAEWIAKAKEGISEKSWEREYEISYDTFEGKAVYEGFTEQHIHEFEYSVEQVQYVYRGWDFGYHHPAVVTAFMNESDQMCVRTEVLGANEGIKDFALRVKQICQSKFPNAQWLDSCDPAGHQRTDKAEFTSVQVLNSLGIYPTSKASNINEGLEIIRQRLLRRNDGKYGMLFHPDCKILIDAFKGGYRYPERKEGVAEQEMPLKDGFYDHLCLSGMSEVETDLGLKKLKNIRVGDMVLTRGGYKKVLVSEKTGSNTEVRTYYFSNGQKLIATKDHPVYVQGKGFIPIENVGYCDKVLSCETLTESKENQNKLLLTDLDLIDIQNQRIDRCACTTSAQKTKRTKRDCVCMNTFGKKQIVKSQENTVYTTEMETHSTMLWRIWHWLSVENISRIIGSDGKKTQFFWKRYKTTLSLQESRQKNGTSHLKGENGIVSMEREPGRINFFFKRIALFVDQSIKHIFPTKQSTVQITANHRLCEVNLVKKSPKRKSDVYNLSVEGHHEYFANSILVSNCDAIRYLVVNYLELAPTYGSVEGSTRNEITSGRSAGMEEYF